MQACQKPETGATTQYFPAPPKGPVLGCDGNRCKCVNASQSVNAPPNGVECARYVEGGSSCGHMMASAAGSAPSLASLPWFVRR